MFSAEISAADAVLFMLTTSLSQDLYKRFVEPAASDADVLRMARLASVAGGVLGVNRHRLLSQTVGDALQFFYTLLSVSLFVPVVAGLASKRAGAFEVLAAVLCGVAATAAVQLGLAAGLPARHHRGGRRLGGERRGMGHRLGRAARLTPAILQAELHDAAVVGGRDHAEGRRPDLVARGCRSRPGSNRLKASTRSWICWASGDARTFLKNDRSVRGKPGPRTTSRPALPTCRRWPRASAV